MHVESAQKLLISSVFVILSAIVCDVHNGDLKVDEIQYYPSGTVTRILPDLDVSTRDSNAQFHRRLIFSA